MLGLAHKRPDASLVDVLSAASFTFVWLLFTVVSLNKDRTPFAGTGSPFAGWCACSSRL